MRGRADHIVVRRGADGRTRDARVSPGGRTASALALLALAVGCGSSSSPSGVDSGTAADRPMGADAPADMAAADQPVGAFDTTPAGMGVEQAPAAQSLAAVSFDKTCETACVYYGSVIAYEAR